MEGEEDGFEEGDAEGGGGDSLQSEIVSVRFSQVKKNAPKYSVSDLRSSSLPWARMEEQGLRTSERARA